MTAASIAKDLCQSNRQDKVVVVAVSVSVLIAWGGASAVIPLLPVYLNCRGSSPMLVGTVMSGFFAAAMLVQYPMGRLSDRIGRKKILIGGLIAYSIGSVLFAAVPDPAAAVLYRALQGAEAGVVDVANGRSSVRQYLINLEVAHTVRSTAQ